MPDSLQELLDTISISPGPVVDAFQWAFILYFIVLSVSYLILNAISFYTVRSYMRRYASPVLPKSFGPLLPPVSIVVPAYNEELTIVSSIRSLMQLEYPQYEIVIVDDGSKDKTTQVLIEAFALLPSKATFSQKIATKPIEQVYRSVNYPNIRLIRKHNGGKADALNVGINLSRYPLFCAVDADSILQRDSLDRLIKIFVDEPKTVAAGGSIRVANGSTVHMGLMAKPKLSDSLLARLQTIEYLRAFLFGRMGWSPLNGMLVISGAFGIFKKKEVLEVGGYDPGTVGEDMELIVRLHKHCAAKKQDYKITFVPDPVCWTEVPEDIKTLRNQRMRWQRGLWESLTYNFSFMFSKNSGAAGWITFPFMLIFEALGPIFEVVAYILTLYFYFSGAIDTDMFLAFILVAFIFGVFISVLALLLEELTFYTYKSPVAAFRLFLVAIAENFGYRQINSWWRIRGTWKWMRGQKHQWGEMKRTGKWQSGAK